jgi:tRNA (mo5U34)-methyltransferase
MNADASALGTFDVVLFLGVLYHLENPLQAVRRVFELTGELAVIETAAVTIPGYEHVPLCEFYESNELNADVSNWWAPNQRALIGLCRAAGFRRVEPLTLAPSQAVSTRLKSTAKYLVAGTGMELPAKRLNTGRYRAIVHAWK